MRGDFLTASKYKVGDVVRVIDTPEFKHIYWVSEMEALCGLEVEIGYVEYNDNVGGYIYHVKNCGTWWWDESYFVPIENEADFEVDNEEFLNIIGFRR